MTRQVTDNVFFHGYTYKLADFQGKGLFSPGKHGIALGPTLSTMAKNHICEYEILDGKLFLAAFWGVGPIVTDGGTSPALPQLFGVHPQRLDTPRWFLYDGLQEPIAFDGWLLLARSELSEMFALTSTCAWAHVDVQEIQIHKGIVVESNCRRKEIKKLRNLILNEADMAEIDALIRDSFHCDYSGLRPIRLKLTPRPRDKEQ